MERGKGPKRGHMYTGLHGKRGGAKEGSHVHRSAWEDGRGQRGVTCTQVYMGRGEGPRRGHMYTGLHGKRGGAKEGSHVQRSTWEEGRGQRRVTCTLVYMQQDISNMTHLPHLITVMGYLGGAVVQEGDGGFREDSLRVIEQVMMVMVTSG